MSLIFALRQRQLQRKRYLSTLVEDAGIGACAPAKAARVGGRLAHTAV